MTQVHGKEHWDGIYAAKTPQEVSWYQETPATSIGLIARAAQGPSSAIVDVGGGASRLVDALLDAGHVNPTVLDLSTVALERAKARLGERAAQVTWIVGDVTAWRPPGPFDVWHDRAVFHFLVEAAARQRYISVMRAALAPGAQAILGTFAADGPERCSGLPVQRWEPAELAEELGPGFRLVEGLHEDHLTPAGQVQRFQFSRFVRL